MENTCGTGFLYSYRGGGFICGLRGGLYDFDPETVALTLLVPVERDKPHHRINDGFVDAAGRLWFGTMNDDATTVGSAFNGWRIERYSPQGDKRGEIRFPCANVTKPAFGGNRPQS